MVEEVFAKPKLSPRDFFLYFGAMATLYWSAGSLIALLFSIVDASFRDELAYVADPYSGSIRFAIASLIVIFPLSLFLFTALKRDALRHPAKFLLPLRKWLFAITIFVTAAALVGDVIALLTSFLGGELTARFAFKVLSVLLVAGTVFWYCLLEIRVRPEAPVGARKMFLVGTGLLVLAAVAYGFAVMGSPATIRKLRFDELRVSDLMSIQWQVVNFWQQKGSVPRSLSELEDDPIVGYRTPTDPRFKEPYEFLPGQGRTFTLCATFELPSVRNGGRPFGTLDSFAGLGPPYNWEHDAGRVCFDRVIDPERYPSLVKPPPENAR